MLELDMTAPSNPILKINDTVNGGFTSAQLVTVAITTGDSGAGKDTSLYSFKIWGDVDGLNDSYVQPAEADSDWVSFGDGTRQVKLTATEGMKTLRAKIRDDVYNTSGEIVATITLDTSKPVVSISGQDRFRVSEQSQRNLANFSFTVDQDFIEYRVMLVSGSQDQNTGTLIGTANGSINTSATTTVDAPFNTSTEPVDVTISGTDLKIASGGEGNHMIKVFVKDKGGNWSNA
jgi:hypothetical protein